MNTRRLLVMWLEKSPVMLKQLYIALANLWWRASYEVLSSSRDSAITQSLVAFTLQELTFDISKNKAIDLTRLFRNKGENK